MSIENKTTSEIFESASKIEEKEEVDYIPLSLDVLEEGMVFGPIDFSVRPESHFKTIGYIDNSYLDEKNYFNCRLMPGEMWGLARVLSDKFGKLNEAAIKKATFVLSGKAIPNEKLTAIVRLNKLIEGNLPVAVFESKTVNSNGDGIFRSVDEVLLFHDADKFMYSEKKKDYVQRDNIEYKSKQKMYQRFDWNPERWKNNIHNEEYASRFGYRGGLPEFITFFDWMYVAQQKIDFKSADWCAYEIKHIKPMYADEDIDVIVEKSGRVCFVRDGDICLLGRIKTSEQGCGVTNL